MVKRWNVYHGNDHLGLKTAKEIREALRQGTLDPFDKVALEGSNIREDLVEVDEIFKETPEDVEIAPAPKAVAAPVLNLDVPLPMAANARPAAPAAPPWSRRSARTAARPRSWSRGG